MSTTQKSVRSVTSLTDSLRRCGLAAVVSVLCAAPGVAEATQKVYSPIVEEGEFAIEYRGHHDFDKRSSRNGAQKMKMEVEYGVTDRWATALEGEFERDNRSDAMHFSATAWENLFQFVPQGKYWLDSGLFVEYEVPSDTTAADKLELKLLLEKSMPKWIHTANVVLEKQLGNNASEGTEYGYAWRSKYLLGPKLEMGFEAHGSLGQVSHTKGFDQQTHQVGPVIYGSLPIGGHGDKIRYEFGYLVGLTDASADGSLKWLVEYETHF